MSMALTVYSGQSKEDPVLDMLVIQRAILFSALGILCIITLFNYLLSKAVTQTTVFEELKTHLINNQLSLMRQDFFDVLLELKDLRKQLTILKTHDFNALRDEAIAFSTDVWKEDIADLQEDMATVGKRHINYSNEITELREQLGRQTKKINELRTDFKALILATEWSTIHQISSPAMSSACMKIMERRGWTSSSIENSSIC
jgi:hypothetical protein